MFNAVNFEGDWIFNISRIECAKHLNGLAITGALTVNGDQSEMRIMGTSNTRKTNTYAHFILS